MSSDGQKEKRELRFVLYRFGAFLTSLGEVMDGRSPIDGVSATVLGCMYVYA